MRGAKILLPSGTWLMPGFDDLSAGIVVMSWPLKVIDPVARAQEAGERCAGWSTCPPRWRR